MPLDSSTYGPNTCGLGKVASLAIDGTLSIDPEECPSFVNGKESDITTAEWEDTLSRAILEQRATPAEKRDCLNALQEVLTGSQYYWPSVDPVSRLGFHDVDRG